MIDQRVNSSNPFQVNNFQDAFNLISYDEDTNIMVSPGIYSSLYNCGLSIKVSPYSINIAGEHVIISCINNTEAIFNINTNNTGYLSTLKFVGIDFRSLGKIIYHNIKNKNTLNLQFNDCSLDSYNDNAIELKNIPRLHLYNTSISSSFTGIKASMNNHYRCELSIDTTSIISTNGIDSLFCSLSLKDSYIRSNNKLLLFSISDVLYKIQQTIKITNSELVTQNTSDIYPIYIQQTCILSQISNQISISNTSITSNSYNIMYLGQVNSIFNNVSIQNHRHLCSICNNGITIASGVLYLEYCNLYKVIIYISQSSILNIINSNWYDTQMYSHCQSDLDSTIINIPSNLNRSLIYCNSVTYQKQYNNYSLPQQSSDIRIYSKSTIQNSLEPIQIIRIIFIILTILLSIICIILLISILFLYKKYKNNNIESINIEMEEINTD